MTTIRRRVLRPPRLPSQPVPVDRFRLAVEKKHRQLEQERIVLARWMTRLKRAFHSIERRQVRVVRLEREIARLERV